MSLEWHIFKCQLKAFKMSGRPYWPSNMLIPSESPKLQRCQQNTLRKYCSFQTPGAPSWGCTPLTPQGLLSREFNLSSFGGTGMEMGPFATERRQQRGQEINWSCRNPWQELWIVREVRPDACDAFLGGDPCGAWVPAVWNWINYQNLLSPNGKRSMILNLNAPLALISPATISKSAMRVACWFTTNSVSANMP